MHIHGHIAIQYHNVSREPQLQYVFPHCIYRQVLNDTCIPCKVYLLCTVLFWTLVLTSTSKNIRSIALVEWCQLFHFVMTPADTRVVYVLCMQKCFYFDLRLLSGVILPSMFLPACIYIYTYMYIFISFQSNCISHAPCFFGWGGWPSACTSAGSGQRASKFCWHILCRPYDTNSTTHMYKHLKYWQDLTGTHTHTHWNKYCSHV